MMTLHLAFFPSSVWFSHRTNVPSLPVPLFLPCRRLGLWILFYFFSPQIAAANVQLTCWTQLSEHSLDRSGTRLLSSSVTPLPPLSARPSFFFPSVSIPLFCLSSPQPPPSSPSPPPHSLPVWVTPGRVSL